MKKLFYLAIPLLIPVVSASGGQGIVRQDGAGGAYTTIGAAISAGETNILITDSGHYHETLQIGDPNLIVGGPPVSLGASQTGANRPVLTPPNGNTYSSTVRSTHLAGFGLFADNSVISNLVLEANPDATVGSATTGPLIVMATNVLILNCKFQIAPGTTNTLGSGYPLLDFAQQGNPTTHVPTTGGPDCNGCIVRNCEFQGVAPGVSPVDPVEGPTSTNGGWGYLGQKKNNTGTGQVSGYSRLDAWSDGREIVIKFEGCYFHHSRDYGIFVTDNNFSGPENITVICNKCRFDANAKGQIRGRGANAYANNCIFTRCLQSNATDAENAGLAIENFGGNQPSGGAFNCLFVNCGSADYGQSAYGGVAAYNSEGLVTVNQCTFVDCLNGVTCGADTPANAYVTNCIFHEIGASVPTCVDASGITLTNGSPELVNGLYPAWTNGLPHWSTYMTPPGTNTAVFNEWRDLGSITISNCMVGTIADEDTSPWTVNPWPPVVGCRLYAGSDSDFTGTDTVTRAVPIFQNRNADAFNPFQLDPSSPGQGMGANLAPVIEPQLAITQEGSTIHISWTQPIWVTGYALKSTPSLNTPSWTAVPGVIDAGGGSYTVPVSVGPGNQFFAIRAAP